MTAIALKERARELMKELSVEERIDLADLLYASIPDAYQKAVDKAWEKEIDRRLDEYETGKALLHSSEEVHAQVRKAIDEVRRSARRGNK